MKKTFSSLVHVNQRFQRSVNLLADQEEGALLDSFLLQGSHLSCLNLISDYLVKTSQRAFTWTGPYGSGKSSLGLFLSGLVKGRESCFTKYTLSTENDEESRNSLHNFRNFLGNVDKWDVITLVGRSGNLEKDFLVAVDSEEASLREGLPVFKKRLEEQNKGALIFIDELGKYLEGSEGNHNCYALQEIAEFFNRGKLSIIFVGILHQSFAGYASNLSRQQQEEWMKVQGRFVDIPLLITADESISLISNSLERDQSFPLPQGFTSLVSTVTRSLKKQKVDIEALSSSLRNCWPLNPISALLLDPISKKRFLQNTRSIFSFLCSKEVKGFDSFLGGTTEKDRLFNPDQLFDYLRENYEQSILASPSESKNWLMASDSLERVGRSGSEIDLKVLKVISLLELFKTGSGLEANLQTIKASLPEFSEEEIQDSLGRLLSLKVIIYRHFRECYALFSGSDFDVDGEIKKLQSTSEQTDWSSITSRFSLPQVVANRHYDETGNLRWFERRILTQQNLLNKENILSDGFASGQFVVLIGDKGSESQEELDRVRDKFLMSSSTSSVLVSTYVPDEKAYNFLSELEAVLKLLDAPQLTDDPVALKELKERKNLLESALFERLEDIFDNRTWVNIEGKRFSNQTSDELTSIASDVCDINYSSAPIIKNELINRDKLSSQIKRAQRQLINAMLFNEQSEDLGFVGFPPEKMIYCSLFKSSNLHKKRENGLYEFYKPEEGQNFYRVFQALSKQFSEERECTLEELCKFLSEPPFGIKRGVSPLLVLLFYLCNRKELSVYIEGVFQAERSDELASFWSASPKDITFKFVPSTQENHEYLDQLSQVLGISAEEEAVTPLMVAKALVRKLFSLSNWVRTTLNIPAESRKLRDAILKAWDPISLLYQEIPQIVGNKNPKVIAAKVKTTFEMLENLEPKKSEILCNKIFALLGEESEDSADLKRRASLLVKMPTAFQTKAFIGKIVNSTDDRRLAWDLLSVCIPKPESKWTEADVSSAETKLVDLCMDFRKLESIAYIEGVASPKQAISLIMGSREKIDRMDSFITSGTASEVTQLTDQINEILKNKSSEDALAALVNCIKAMQR